MSTHLVAAVFEYQPVTTASFCTRSCVSLGDSITGPLLFDTGNYTSFLAIDPVGLSAILPASFVVDALSENPGFLKPHDWELKKKLRHDC